MRCSERPYKSANGPEQQKDQVHCNGQRAIANACSGTRSGRQGDRDTLPGVGKPFWPCSIALRKKRTPSVGVFQLHANELSSYHFQIIHTRGSELSGDGRSIVSGLSLRSERRRPHDLHASYLCLAKIPSGAARPHSSV
jgi:hypothetical protein